MKKLTSQAPIFMIEGNIGAGKSTFLSVISSYLNVQLIYEPHTSWQNIGGNNLLDLFYKDSKRWAYTFQSYAFISRIKSHTEQLQNNEKPIAIIERSIFTDRYCFARNCYEMGMMNELEWHLYQQWFSWLMAIAPLPNAFIYLRTTPQVCYERMKKRNRAEESQVQFEYLSLLHDRHEEWLIDKKNIDPVIENIPVLILECSQDFEHNQEVQKALISDIMSFAQQQFQVPADRMSRCPSVI